LSSPFYKTIFSTDILSVHGKFTTSGNAMSPLIETTYSGDIIPCC